MRDLTEAIKSLTDVPFRIDGKEPETESDFDKRVSFSYESDENNVLIWSADKPEGVTFQSVKDAKAKVISDRKAAEARSQRDLLLAETDYTQMPDAPVTDVQAWADYRQALRDVPEQSGFPDTIDWPVKPEE